MKCRYLLFVLVLLACFSSCKKDSHPPQTPATLILGQWFTVKQVSQLYNNGVQISTSTQTSFTTTDFVEYYSDGSGYYSKSSAEGPDLEEFTYTLKGLMITEFTSIENKGTAATITNLTANSLSIHAVSLVPDPNDPSVTDTEIDDLNYTR